MGGAMGRDGGVGQWGCDGGVGQWGCDGGVGQWGATVGKLGRVGVCGSDRPPHAGQKP